MEIEKKLCGRITKHPPHGWVGRHRMVYAESGHRTLEPKVYHCPGEVTLEGGNPASRPR